MLYVAGNHDPLSLMPSSSDALPLLSDRSLNLHRRVIKIEEGLYVAGIGGSCPAFEVQEDGSLK